MKIVYREFDPDLQNRMQGFLDEIPQQATSPPFRRQKDMSSPGWETVAARSGILYDSGSKHTHGYHQ